MNTHEVNFHEGMFLVPHHFQAMHRHALQTLHLNSEFDLHYNWGLRSIEIDKDALNNKRFVVRNLTARLRDGTVVRVPQDGPLPELDLEELLKLKNPTTISLAVPALQMGRANSADEARKDTRYRIETRESEDENTGEDAQPLQFRLPNLRLLATTDDDTGYSVIPIGRVRKGERAEALPELDGDYIPPVLACDAWPGLQDGILEQIFNRIGRKVELLSQQVTSRGISFDSRNQGDVGILEQLRALNEAHALLGVQIYAHAVHPFPSYLELARLVGK